jgi:hypothetical protein
MPLPHALLAHRLAGAATGSGTACPSVCSDSGQFFRTADGAATAIAQGLWRVKSGSAPSNTSGKTVRGLKVQAFAELIGAEATDKDLLVPGGFAAE